MSGAPTSVEQQLAQAAATIADLRRQLAASQGQIKTVSDARDAALADARTKAAALAAARVAAQQAADAHNAAVASLQANAAALGAAADHAKADFAAIAAKFDKLMGDPVDPGITVFQKYRTDADNAEHATLAAARLHLAATQLDINAADAPQMAARLKAHPDAVQTLIDTAT